MATMTVIATTAIPDHLRGALTRWMIEPAPGLYVGTLSARVRTELWTAVSASIGDGAAVLLHPDANEQGFTLHTAGRRRRTPIDFDGLTLIALNPAEPDNESVNP
ncbi:type I-E CRISPR-associated endoribonuclease Cas2e [Thermomonospora curvata]|uniref:CRISPR-associated protein Cas2 n=1 Tax=Thermomonospora curvata (strain ATCC 19995 / DSM 43183 / JCM 3096 / KCTC 9072 / NBRC 15933 / NCIMB 10081 / Henssen B9) TaxID=471852 RepID=D1A6Q8_THECD|nr:type I-E CRISPR-associated endoribonuclease Cas2e [Thermomonospora curvata]ACY96533.1 CRISPR-associated protein Cas2 [Thermomonospora curvata DSM 43183]